MQIQYPHTIENGLGERLVFQGIEHGPDGDRVGVLKEKILAAVKEIEESPIDGKYHRVLYRTFINPVGSQEKTADFLNMSFSTYRRYLSAGTQRVAEMLWGRRWGERHSGRSRKMISQCAYLNGSGV